jgi:hypothetical protein
VHLAVLLMACVEPPVEELAEPPPMPPWLYVEHDPLVPERPLEALDAWQDGEDPCLGGAECLERRELWIDLDELGIGGGSEWIAYDVHELTRPIRSSWLRIESELSVAVRLVISEVGADRLVVSRYGLLEALGVLATVRNRRDPAVYNPENIEQAPVFPGCGLGASFNACANAAQYNGMETWRALDPTRHYPPDVLQAAVDLAVVAWWIHDAELLEDFTGGATNYVHRCGGAAYGLSTHHCDAHMGRPERDVRGAEPSTGPLLLKAPGRWLAHRGFYALYESRRVEYDPWWVHDGASLQRRSSAFSARDPVGVGSLGALVEALGPPSDPRLLNTIKNLYKPEGMP